MKERTTFVIAHRLSTVRNATRILVFEDGRIVEIGTFDELVQRGGAFATLAKAQFLVDGEPDEPPRPAHRPAELAEPTLGDIVEPPPNRITGDAAE
jgi:ATP-binding cassette, subfamily B, beta-glucan exporter